MEFLWDLFLEYYTILLPIGVILLSYRTLKTKCVSFFVWSITSTMLDKRENEETLPDHPLDLNMESINDPNVKDLYDEMNFLCVNSTDNSYLHVGITRLTDRKSLVKLNLCINGDHYSLPGSVVTYNNAANVYSAQGIKFTPLDEGFKWRISYTGPLRRHAAAGDTPEEESMKLLFIWNAHSALLNTDQNEFTQSNIQQYLMKLYENDEISIEEMVKLCGQPQSYNRTALQLGGIHGFVQVLGGEQKELTFNGVRRHSYGEITDAETSTSSYEQILVSKQGYFSYTRLPKPQRKNEKPAVDQSVLSQLCSLKMYPNCEMVEGSMDLAAMYSDGWNMDETPQVNDSLGSFELKVANNREPSAVYNVSNTSRRQSLLVPLTFNHQLTDLTLRDGGLGLLMYNDVHWEFDGEKCSGSVHEILMKDAVSEEASQISVPLLSVTHTEVQSDAIILSLDNPDCKNACLVGGKGSQLAVLYQADIKQCTVPDAICLSIKAFQLQLRFAPALSDLSSRLEKEIDASNETVKEICEEIRDTFLNADINSQTRSELDTALQRFPPDTRFAVRSSAIGEDGEELSAAGQMDTILGVKGLADIHKAIKQCWASHFTFMAVQYKRNHGQTINSGMGVVIQKMVPAEQAGVLFSYDPVTCDCGTMVINSNFGVGESVVSGQAEPDTFHITRKLVTEGQDNVSRCEFSITDKKIGSKSIQHIVSESGDVVLQDTSSSPEKHLWSSVSIDDDTVIKLCGIALQIEQGFGHPCDIEWAISDNTVYLLQSRPITTLNQESEYELLHEFDSPYTKQDELVSTMNVGEVIPCAITPLTQSCVADKLEMCLQSFNEVNVGTAIKPKIHRFCKIAYNKLFLSVHMFESNHDGKSVVANRKVMELALAGHLIEEMTDEDTISFTPSSPFYQRFLHGFALLWTTWRGYANMTKRAPAMESLRTPHTEDCHQMYQYIEEALILVRDMFILDMPMSAESAIYSQLLMGILTKGEPKWETKHYSDIASLLGCNLSEVLSAGVPEKLEELAAAIKNDPELSEKFVIAEQSEAHNLLISADTNSAIRSAFMEFIELFGHRSVGEMELYEKCWEQDPSGLIDTLQMMVRNSGTKHQTCPNKSVDEVVSNLQSDIKDGAKKFIKWVLPKAKHAVNRREIGKSLLVKSICKVKLAYWRLGELMHKQGYLPSEDLVFFFTHSEISQMLKTRNGQLISRATKRKRIYEKMRKMKFPRFCKGRPEPLPSVDNLGQVNSEVDVELKGMPVSIGEVTGTARVVTTLKDAHTIQKNDIMIVHYTDVGWAPYFPLVSGVVTELGGLVSHGAVVAREYGIPCIASCQDATSVFRSGDTVYLNGSTGTIKRIMQPASASS